MYATDFVFDGVNLSDYGLVICQFEGASSLSEVSIGSPLNFKTVSLRKGNRFALADTSYDSAIEISFDICKDDCLFDSSDDMIIDDDLFLSLTRWMLRDSFYRIRFSDDREIAPRYYRGCFTSISRLTLDSYTYGLRVTFLTDRPYALSEKITVSHQFEHNSTWDYLDSSYLTGTLFPDVDITLLESGDLTITNSLTGCQMEIKNCSEGETISIRGGQLIIFSSLTTHKIQQDFNFDFFTIGNSYRDTRNRIMSTLACEMTISYEPKIKDTPQ